MAINIKFDLVGNPEPPTIILATRNGNKLGQLDVNEESIELTDKLNDVSEMTFTINKYIDGKITNLWDKVVDFKLVYCKEWDTWFEITVELNEEIETIKTVFCKQLGQAELSQLMLYNIEINTEEDIARDGYKIAILFNDFDHDASILHRLLKDKAPHYSIVHVDSTIAKIQRMFSFDGTSIYDAFQEIAEEIGCLFVFHSNSDTNGKIKREISVFDLESNCLDCHHRGEFTRICPECGSTNILEGYGDDTTIFVTADELANDIQLTTDTDSIKNCFKLEAGDDLMTATIRNCNPNGTDYLWYISDAVKIDMSQELVNKIESYDKSYQHYQKDYNVNIDTTILQKYNNLVKKYQVYNDELKEIATPIVGYPALMQAYYNTIDLELYLKSALMPTVKMSDTNAKTEARKLISSNLSPVAAESIEYISLATADNIVLSMAKIIVDSRYKVKVNESSFNKNSNLWTGNFVVTNYSDEEDTAISSTVNVTVNEDYGTFVQQKIDKALKKEDTDDLSISGLFKKSLTDFKAELKKYSLNCLTSFHNSCQSCIDILIKQGVGNKSTWSGQDKNLYDDLYVPYLNKLNAIEYETKIRQDEVDLIAGIYDIDGDLKTYGLKNYIEDTQEFIHNELDFERYLGVDLWHEFCSFRREDKYSNSNYISDGLNNVELFDNALKFIDTAQKEIYKSAELQHSISSSLKNLLSIEKFSPLVNSFKVGNWLRIMINDELYKLRLIEYSIDYGDFDNISVEFSDVVKLNSTVKSIKGVIEQATKMATSYDTVQKQAEDGKDSSKIIAGWSLKGMDVTNTKLIQGATDQTQVWDEHGMLFRKYDEITDTYDDTQLKIVNSTMAITDDGWKTVKTAVGEYYYFHPVTNKLTKAYGINAETLVGRLILGEELGIYNESGTMTFNNDGFEITNGVNSFRVNPNEDMLLCISNNDQDVFYVTKNGGLYIECSGTNIDISENAAIINIKDNLGNYSTTEQTKEFIRAEVANVSGDFTELKLTVDGLTVTDQNGTTLIKGDKIQTSTLEVDAANVSGELTAATISADNLTAGEIDANVVKIKNLTVDVAGSISFEDLSDYENVQEYLDGIEQDASDAYDLAYDASDTIDSWGYTYGGTTYIDGGMLMTGTVIASTLLGGSVGLLNSNEDEVGYLSITGAYSSDYKIQLVSEGALYLTANDGDTYIEGDFVTLGGTTANTSGNNFYPDDESYTLGRNWQRWDTLYVVSGVDSEVSASTTSDIRKKKDLDYNLSQYDLFFDNLQPVKYKYNSGTSNRFHTGFISQDVESALTNSGLTSQDFAGFIKAQNDTKDGSIDDYRYMLRYEEFIALNTYQIQKVKARIAELESEISMLKNII